MSVVIRATGWELEGRPLPWIWGQVNYWDIERTHWRDVLRTYAEQGHEVVSTAVLPGIHQVRPGEYDFGSYRPQKDLKQFLHEIKDLGLKCLLWVGPRDLPGAVASGYPEDFLLEAEALVRDAFGNFILSSPCHGGEVYALPSLISDRLLNLLEPFAHELMKILAETIHPDGPVIGLGLTQAPGWEPAMPAYAADYGPEALVFYREFLAKKYKKIEGLNAAYGKVFGSFAEIDPPRNPDPASDQPDAWRMDWARVREAYLHRAAEMLYEIFSPLSLDRVPVIMAAAPAERPQTLSGPDLGSRLAFAAPEISVRTDVFGQEFKYFLNTAQAMRYSGWFNLSFTAPNAPVARQEFRLTGATAGGVRAWDALNPAGAGVNPGFLMNRLGAPQRPIPEFWLKIKELSKTEGFWQSQIHADLVLLNIPEFERVLYLQTRPSSRYDLVEPSLLKPPEMNLDEETRAYQQRLQHLEHYLKAGQYAYLVADGDSPLDRFKTTQTLVVPGMTNMAADFQDKLALWVEKGLQVLLVGPLPNPPQEETENGTLADLLGGKARTTKGRGTAKNKTGRLLHLPEMNEAKFRRLLQQAGVARLLTLDEPGLWVTFHHYRGRTFVAALNPKESGVATVARREGKFVLKDFWQTNKYYGGNNEVRVWLPPRSVKFWELIVC